mgnify:FL=1
MSTQPLYCTPPQRLLCTAPGRERVLFIVAHTENWPSRARPPCADGWSRSAKMPSDRKVSGLRKRCLSRPVVHAVRGTYPYTRGWYAYGVRVLYVGPWGELPCASGAGGRYAYPVRTGTAAALYGYVSARVEAAALELADAHRAAHVGALQVREQPAHRAARLLR